MKLKIPKSFELGARKYTVEVVDDLDRVDGLNGCCNPDRQLIRIRSDLPASVALVTLWHEIAHAMEAYGLKLEGGHDACDRFGEAMAQILQSAKYTK